MQKNKNKWLVFSVCGSMVVKENVHFVCSALTQWSVTQPCVGQVLGDSFAEIESLGMPEHFCEDELLFILNTDKRWGQHVAYNETFCCLPQWTLILYETSLIVKSAVVLHHDTTHVALLWFAWIIRKSLTLKYYAKKILYFLRQQNTLKSLKSFLEQHAEQQTALEGVSCFQTSCQTTQATQLPCLAETSRCGVCI